MKKIFLTLVMGIIVSLNIQAQEFNFIPSSQELNDFADGWYKFDLQGTSFDVEVKAGRLAQGNIKWFDGSSYSGTLAGSELSGKGTYTWPDGSKYEGSLKKHQRHGKGSLIDPTGVKWSGKWKNNQKNGKGKIFNAEGELVKEGVWASNQLVTKK